MPEKAKFSVTDLMPPLQKSAAQSRLIAMCLYYTGACGLTYLGRGGRNKNLTVISKTLHLMPLALLVAHVGLLPALASESGWCLKQKSTSIGKQTISVSPSYLSIENENARTVTFAAAPEWKVITYSKQRKIYFVTTPNAFTAKFAYVSGSWVRTKLAFLQFVKGELVHKEDVPTRIYSVAHSAENTFRQNDERVWNPTIEALEDGKLSKQSNRIVANIYQLPIVDGIPIAVTALVDSQNIGRKAREILKTTSISRCTVETNSDPSMKGFKLCKDDQDFCNANNNRMDLKDFADYIGPQ
jgi:hypothetical protein